MSKKYKMKTKVTGPVSEKNSENKLAFAALQFQKNFHLREPFFKISC
jgi:hypothetical protein